MNPADYRAICRQITPAFTATPEVKNRHIQNRSDRLPLAPGTAPVQAPGAPFAKTPRIDMFDAGRCFWRNGLQFAGQLAVAQDAQQVTSNVGGGNGSDFALVERR